MNKFPQPPNVPQWQSKLKQALPERCWISALSSLPRSQEMIEQALAVGKAPIERFEFGRRQGKERERNFHDVIER